jgi:tripeptidyl-peptidase I
MADFSHPDQYSIPKGTKKASGNQLGVFESLNDHFVANDLNLYWANLYPYVTDQFL